MTRLLHAVTFALLMTALGGCTTDGTVTLRAPFDGQVTVRVYPAGLDCSRLSAAAPDAELGEPLDEDTVVRGEALDLELPSETLTLVAVYESTNGCARAVACEPLSPGQDVELRARDVVCDPGCGESACEGLDAGVDGGADAGVDAGVADAGPVDAGPVDAGPVDAGPADAGPVDAGCCINRGAGFDCDGDGLDNALEQDDGARRDTDSDGTPDECDLDSDDDGLLDADECPLGIDDCLTADPDAGVPAYRDEDSDDDGLPDGEECCRWAPEMTARFGVACDPDGDGLPAHVDADSDGDGIDDDLERTYASCTPPAGGVCAPVDSDGDGLCNALDPDSDNDGATDAQECLSATSITDCDAPYSLSTVRCGADELMSDELAEFCGSCARRGCTEGVGCIDNYYCAPQARFRVRVTNLPLPATMAGESPPPPDVPGRLVFHPLHDDGMPLDPISFDVAWRSTSGAIVAVPSSSGELFDALMDTSTAACASASYSAAPRCVAAYEATLERDSDGACVTLPGIFVVATALVSVDTPMPLTFPSIPTPVRAAIGNNVQRGWQYYEPPAGGGVPWTRTALSQIVVDRPSTSCSPLFP